MYILYCWSCRICCWVTRHKTGRGVSQLEQDYNKHCWPFPALWLGSAHTFLSVWSLIMCASTPESVHACTKASFRFSKVIIWHSCVCAAWLRPLLQCDLWTLTNTLEILAVRVIKYLTSDITAVLVALLTLPLLIFDCPLVVNLVRTTTNWLTSPRDR